MKLHKNISMKRVLMLLCIILLAGRMAHCDAQDYKYEVGVEAGISSYWGDANQTWLIYHPGFTGGFLFRYVIDYRWAIRANLSAAMLSGNTADSPDILPGGAGYKFNTTLFDAGCRAEFNFFNYGVKRWEAHYSWFTPSLVAGLGLFSCLNDEPKFTATIPLGLGVKFKLSNRINLGAYWMVSKVISDKVDNKPNPNGEYGRWNNQDWYSTAQIALSVNFYKICAPCRSGKGKPNGKYIWTY
jgi:hypothetical protein